MPKNSTSPKQNDSRCKPKKKRRCLNCVIQKLEDPKNNWKFVRPQNIAKVLRNPKQQLKHQPTLKNRIWPNFNPPKKGQDSCLNFEICSLGVGPVLLAVLLSCWQCSSGESQYSSSIRSIRVYYSTRSTRLSTRSICLSTRSIFLSIRLFICSTRSIPLGLFITDGL